MSNTDDRTSVYISKMNELVAAGREDLIAAIVADYVRGTDSPEPEVRSDAA